ncbi:MAG: PEGA domain-containing protein [Acidobacteria bacterium]|nr:PEGA domain-containing protein [Acidobacteriota bacterium]
MNMMLQKLFFLVLVLSFITISAEAQKIPPRARDKPTEKTNPISTISSVALFSDPVGANVYLNDKLLGKTTLEGKLVLGQNKPKTLTLKAGKYKFRFEHPDYETDIKEISLNSGESKPLTGTLKPKFGFLLLANLSKEATLFLDDQVVDIKNLSWQEDGSLKLKVPLGEHELKVTLKKHQPFINQYQIKDATPMAIRIDLKQQLTSLIVKSSPGARVYLDNEERGTITSDGKLVVNELIPEKNYRLSVEREGYKKFEKEIFPNLETENLIEASLSLRPNSSEFVDNFDDLVFWDAPKEWEAKKGYLRINTREVGLPKERSYCNANVVFGLRLLNSRGAAWVVRANDKENYYLFCINGIDGAYPNKLVTYICRKGKIDLTQPATAPSPLPSQLKASQSQTYRIEILIKDNVIEHIFTDNQTGERVSIGFFRDEKNLFPCGNIGFVAPFGEDFQAYGFVIKPTN